MALIPPFFSDCVVAIGTNNPNSHEPAWGASGFLYGSFLRDGDDGMKFYKTYLVTNKHVLRGHDMIYIRANPLANGPAKGYSALLVDSDGKQLWTGHRVKDVDVAVLPITFDLLRQDGMQAQYFQDDIHVLDTKSMKIEGTAEGDGVYVMGFPMGLVGRKRNTVIVRGGVMARIRETLDNPNLPFLLDATVFPGNSGGPAISRPEVTAIEGTLASNRASLIGVVAAYVPYRDVAVSPQTGRPRVVFEENSGLTHVYSVDTIRQTIKRHEKRSGGLKDVSPKPSSTASESA